MKWNVVFVIITMLIINTVFVFSGRTNEITIKNNGADVPIWEVGDYWKYDVEFDGSMGETADFSLSISGLKFTVDQVLSDKYKIDVNAPTGGIVGQATVSIGPINLDGSISNAGLNGFYYVDKSNLGMINEEGYLPDITFSGMLKRTSINADLDFELTNLFSNLQFPLDVSNEWMVPSTIFTVHYDAHVGIININDRSSEDDLFYPLWLVLDEHYMVCKEKNDIEVPFGSYKDSYKIEWKDDPNQYMWYSPEAKYIVKAEFSNLDLYILFKHLSIELVESNYEPPNDPPITPNVPSGETSGYAYVAYEYSTSATDPDGHNVKYGFDWGDGTEITWTTFVSSGDTASATHIYTSDGNYDIKAKAQDSKGGESSWSEQLTVTIAPNSLPGKPSKPSGPTDGGKGVTYTYTADTTDPDDDQIYYLFNWGDGTDSGWLGPEDSGDTISANHAWSSKGNYQIKVKAKDEHGAVSDWSDSLSVSMPKNKMVNLLVLRFLQRLENCFSWLERLSSSLPFFTEAIEI